MKSLRNISDVRLHGPVAELWLHGCKAGLLFDWVFEGWSKEWRIEAERYKLDPFLIRNGEREIKIVLDTRAGRMEVKGVIWTDYTADGHSHRAIIIKGREVQWQRQRAAPATARG